MIQQYHNNRYRYLDIKKTSCMCNCKKNKNKKLANIKEKNIFIDAMKDDVDWGILGLDKGKPSKNSSSIRTQITYNCQI